MPLYPQSVTATGTGASTAIKPHSGARLLKFTASSWGSAALEACETENGTYVPVKDVDGAVVITENDWVLVPAGPWYRMNVSAHTADITMQAVEIQGD